MADALAGYEESAVDANDSRYAMDKRLFVEFFRRPILNTTKSAEAGRPVHDEFDMVRIIVPGDRNSTFESKVTNEHKIRFADRWQRYISGQEQAQSGTPLEMWPQMTVAMCADLKAMKIHTVEQLAEMSDAAAQQIMGNFALRQRAQAFLDLAKSDSANTKMAAELEKRDNEIALLRSQMNEILANQSAKAPAGKGAKEA